MLQTRKKKKILIPLEPLFFFFLTFKMYFLFLKIYIIFFNTWDFPGGSNGKESACQVRDLGLIPGSEDPRREEW